MNPINYLSKKYSGLWCGQRKRPGAFTQISVGHLTAAFLFYLLNNLSYERVSTND